MFTAGDHFLVEHCAKALCPACVPLNADFLSCCALLPSLCINYITLVEKKECAVCVYVGEMEWKPGRVQSGGGVSRDAVHHQQGGGHLSQCSSGQRDTRPGLWLPTLHLHTTG